jgi:hypothetical protein
LPGGYHIDISFIPGVLFAGSCRDTRQPATISSARMKAVLAALGAARYPPFSAQTRSIERFNHGWQQIPDWVLA